jgi:dynein intermediate chain 1
MAIQAEMQKQAKAKAKEPGKREEETAAPPKEKKPELMAGVKMTKAVKVMERMVNQNSYDDIAQDFKYWEDQSDQFRDGEGTLLPLWKFYNERAKRRHVTAIAWNPEYHDLFAVGYGSFDFIKQMSGLICCYSLKNPSHPEYAFTTESGVMCLDFHPQHSSLLAVGCYDGTVLVYDVRSKLNRPIRQSTVKNGKHTDPVWQVSWQEEDLSSKALNFFSVSSDGRVTMWTMSKSELTYQDVMLMKMVSTAADGDPDDDATLGSLAGGCCFDFHKTTDHLFVVGTEEGHVHKCSKAYNSQYLETFVGHHMAVYTVKWNGYHPKVFLSASADWTVKLWDHQMPKPVMSFDLNNAVGDVAWSPFSITTFAAATSDGKVHVYDLHENKHEPMCEQKVARKARLTKIAFNPKHPILLVGDDRGCVTSLKLSPNLRKGTNDVERLETIIDASIKGEMPEKE